MLRGFIAGIVLTLAVILAAGYFGIVSGRLIPANADAKPGRFEKWAARASLRATLRREVTKTKRPLVETDKNLLAGIKLYGENCAACHGTATGDRSTTNIAKGLYQKPPQLASDGVERDPESVIFWKIKHGIRLTGMPAFSNTLNDTQLWQMTLFLKHMDRLPPNSNRAWHAMKTPSS
ncbi:MAG TPA: cytochrome c [Candidatus Baltobacteraceae bacterium]|jgi:mono/diheme cytochrome c family protein